jgi:hypothetical protein
MMSKKCASIPKLVIIADKLKNRLWINRLIDIVGCWKYVFWLTSQIIGKEIYRHCRMIVEKKQFWSTLLIHLFKLGISLIIGQSFNVKFSVQKDMSICTLAGSTGREWTLDTGEVCWARFLSQAQQWVGGYWPLVIVTSAWQPEHVKTWKLVDDPYE